MINEIKSECIYVGVLWIFITWGIMLVDIQHRWRTEGQDWEYVVTTEDAWAIAATTGGRKGNNAKNIYTQR